MPDSVGSDAAARATLLKLTLRKWRMIRLFERALKLVLPLLPSPRRPGSTDRPPDSILVVEYWNLGDLAILVPFLQNLRRMFPAAHVALLVNFALAGFLEGQGLVDEFIPVRVPWAQHFSRWKKYNLFSGQWISFARTLLSIRKRQFEWSLSGRMDVRDNFLMWISGATRRIGYGFAGGAFLLTDRVTPNLSSPHRADLWLNLLGTLGHRVDRSTGRFNVTDVEKASARAFLADRGIPQEAFLIGVHPGARIATRRWGEDHFAAVAKEILRSTDAHVVWFSDPGHPSPGPQWERCHSATLDFRSFLGLLAQCQLLVCNDSGPMHLANLLHVPVVAVFGSTNPIWFGPRGGQDRIVIRPEFWCRPCFDYCKFDQPYCLSTISPDSVIRSVATSICEIRDTATPPKNLMCVE
jgi:heptosyltransferase-2